MGKNEIKIVLGSDSGSMQLLLGFSPKDNEWSVLDSPRCTMH